MLRKLGLIKTFEFELPVNKDKFENLFGEKIRKKTPRKFLDILPVFPFCGKLESSKFKIHLVTGMMWSRYKTALIEGSITEKDEKTIVSAEVNVWKGHLRTMYLFWTIFLILFYFVLFVGISLDNDVKPFSLIMPTIFFIVMFSFPILIGGSQANAVIERFKKDTIYLIHNLE